MIHGISRRGVVSTKVNSSTKQSINIQGENTIRYKQYFMIWERLKYLFLLHRGIFLLINSTREKTERLQQQKNNRLHASSVITVVKKVLFIGGVRRMLFMYACSMFQVRLNVFSDPFYDSKRRAPDSCWINIICIPTT